MPIAKINPQWGSHLPVLFKLIGQTSGAVAELGCGLFSTTYLHWACYPDRRLVTYEAQERWWPFLDKFRSRSHKIVHVTDWSLVDLSEKWAVAFVDHDNINHMRCEEIARLTHAEYVVAHDAEPEHEHHYGYSRIEPLFTSRWQYTKAGAQTAVYSNVHDVSKLVVT